MKRYFADKYQHENYKDDEYDSDEHNYNYNYNEYDDYENLVEDSLNEDEWQ